MTLALVAGAVLLVLLLVSIAAGAFCLGLYRGEKGRRQAAESLLVLGVPEPPQAKRMPEAVGRPAPPHPQAALGFDDATVEKGARMIKEDFTAAGMKPPSDAEARDMARSMLLGGIGIGEGDDIAIAGADAPTLP